MKNQHAISRRIEITKQVEIRAIHNLENANLSPEENKQLYGPCFRPHGHHYKVQVTLSGAVDKLSGLIVNRDKLSEILQRKIVQPFDGTDLNKHFKNTACEALAIEFFEILKGEFPDGARLVRVAIQETRKNYFEFSPDTYS